MSLFEQVNTDIKAAMKAREKEKLEALRNIKKSMLEARTAKGAGAELSDDEALKIISKLAKQGADSAAIYKEQGRQDLHDHAIVYFEPNGADIFWHQLNPPVVKYAEPTSFLPMAHSCP